MHLTDFFHTIATNLDQGEAVVLATLVSASGSVPRKSGTRMALVQGGFIGTIGGGGLEAKVERRMSEIKVSEGFAIEKFRLTKAEAENAGMICGGECEVLIEFLAATQDNYNLFSELTAGLQAGNGEWIVCRLAAGKAPVRSLWRDRPLGMPLSVQQTAGGKRRPALFVECSEQWFLDPVFPCGKVVFAGGGHVALATARLAHQTGFDVAVVDDRDDFANMKRFPFALQTVVSTDFSQCFKDISIRPEDYVCVMTRGHAHDADALACALRTPARFVGMIGSSRKRAAIYERMLGQGFSQGQLDAVHCPIGLEIGADSPEEIAVSIMAQIIEARSRS